MNKQFIMCFIILLCISTMNIIAQVTIGSEKPPVKAALLQLKQYEPTNPITDNSNSDKGFGLPRVKLESLISLKPFLGTSVSEETLMLHQGLMIYNLTNRPGDGLEPGVYVWDGRSFWVRNDRVNLSDFSLDFLLDGVPFNDGEIAFSSGLSTKALLPKKLTINWNPKGVPCDLIWISEENDKIEWNSSLVSSTGTGGNFVLDLDPKAFIQSELDKKPFLEKTTTLLIRARSEQGDMLSKRIKITQVHHAINIEGIKDGMYITLGKPYKVNIKSNINWEMNVTGNVSIIQNNGIPTSSIPKPEGEDYTFVFYSTPLNEGKEVILTFSAPNGEVTSIPIKLKATKEYANSYMVVPKGLVQIPIRQAYIAWKNELNTDLDQSNNKMSVELIWQDSQDLVYSVSFLNDGTTGLDRSINVLLKTAAVKMGNALVALKIDGQIVWSWHVWVTDYLPNEKMPAQGTMAVVTAGKVYNRNNGTRNYVLMDRDLGATRGEPASTSNSAANIGMMGFFYQWGRKDPFAPRKDYTTSTATVKQRSLYNINNVLLNPGVSDNGITANDVPTNIKYNVINTIKNPMIFYKGAATNDNDWYSAEPNVVNSEAWLENYNDAKGIYDPCPLGWRVPVSTYTPYSFYHGLPKKAAEVNGTCTNYMPDLQGYISLTGGLSITGTFMGNVSNIWLADKTCDYQSPEAWIQASNLKVHWVPTARASAFSIRCVKN